jgi:hypothetical protein
VLYGTLVGTVADPSGAVVPSATVTITNQGTGQSRETTTNEAGAYSFPNVQAGTYHLTASAGGFRTYNQEGVLITVNNVLRLDIPMEVGQITETVTVEGAGAALQTDKADVHTELDSKEVTDLPLAKYRNYQSLINLVPGATPARFQNANTDTPARSLTTNVNGTNRNNNGTKVDGATNTFIWLPHHTVYVPSAETIETVNVSTNNFDADQGIAGGAAITVVTKSGTNEFHGSAFALHENGKTSAKDFFFREEQRPHSIVNIDGYTLGGPIKKDKVFFFTGWEGTRERVTRNNTFTVPTAEQRLGDFSGFETTIYDPATGNADGSGRTPFPNNIVPLDRQSEATRMMQDLIPAPNLPDTDNNFFNRAIQSMNRDNFDVKINWNSTEKFQMFGKYTIMDAQVTGQFALGPAGGPCLCDGGAGVGDTVVQVATIGYTYTITPSFLYDATYGWTRMGHTSLGEDFELGNFGSEVLGIPGVNGPDPRQAGMPRFIINGYTDLGQTSGWIPAFRNDQSYTVTQNFSWLKGAHEIRFGFEGMRHNLNHWQPEVGGGPRGAFTFNQGLTGLRGEATNQFNSWAGYLLGLPSLAQKSIQFEKLSAFELQLGAYVRDRWQVTPKLTATLGLRWEKYPMMTRGGSRPGIEQYDPATNLVTLGGIAGNPRDLDIATSNRLFGPRVGLAYRLGDSTVLRAGYGITFNPMPLARPNRGFFPLTIAAEFPGDNSFQPFQPIEQGIPEVVGPDVSSGVVELPPITTMQVLGIDNFLRRGYIQSWNFIVEHKLPAEFIGTVGYVGTQTVGQFARWDGNTAPPGTGSSGRPLFDDFERTAATYFFNGFLSANYHALQTSLNRRAADGLHVKGAYTYSKAINMVDDDGTSTLMWNLLDVFARNRAQAGYNQAHVFQLGFSYDVPFGAGKPYANSGAARWILGDWQVNGILSAFTGRPFTVTASGSSLNAPGNSQTADQIKPEVERIGSLDEYFDKTAFAPVDRTTGTIADFGTTGRNLLTGPGNTNLDLSLFRNFPLTERFTLQFRAEAFNLSNTPHFNNPAVSVNAGDFMRITSTQLAAPNRSFRFGLRLGW